MGEGVVLVSGYGSILTNKMLGEGDNLRLFANVLRVHLAPGGIVYFDDLHQGISSVYDAEAFFSDERLHATFWWIVGLWFVYVLGSTRLRAPVMAERDPSEADLVRHAGGLIARTVATHHAARRLFDGFFANVARAVRGATGSASPDRGELWQWLERHAAVLPQELDQLKTWYAEAHAERKVPLVPLQNLLDTLGKRLNT